MGEKSPETSLLTKSSRNSVHKIKLTMFVCVCVLGGGKLGGWPWRRFKRGQGQIDLGETNRSDICLTTYHYDGERLMMFIHQTMPGQISVSEFKDPAAQTEHLFSPFVSLSLPFLPIHPSSPCFSPSHLILHHALYSSHKQKCGSL